MKHILKNLFYSQAFKFPELPTLLFIYLFFGLLAFRENLMLRDLDVCWLIRTGELIWNTGNLPETDIFSFTHYDKPWVLYQWGFELFLGGLHILAGLGGVVWGGIFLIALSYSFLFYFLLRIGIHRCIGIFLIALAMVINGPCWYSRPNTASILFYIIVLTTLESYRSESSKRIWFLPFLFLLWANIHLGFTSGLLIILFYAVWAFFFPGEFKRNNETKKDANLFFIIFLCILITLINPYHFGLYEYLWRLAFSSNMNSGIGELQSPNFHSSDNIPLIALILLLFWFGSVKYKGRSLLLSLTCITLMMSLFSSRHIPYLTIPTVIHLAYVFKEKQRNLSTSIFSIQASKKGWAWGLVATIITFIWVLAISKLESTFYDFPREIIPKQLTAQLETLVDEYKPSRIFIYGDGGQWNDYLIYRLYPKIRVFIDTRFDMYGDDFFLFDSILSSKVYCDFNALKPFDVNFLIIKKPSGKVNEKHSEISQSLPGFTDPWILIYEDVQSKLYQNNLLKS